MKSREEYEASIFAKRNALIAKRKKTTRIAASALSIMICLGAAVTIPNLIHPAVDKSESASVTDNSGELTENSFDIESYSEAGTFPVSYDMLVPLTKPHIFNTNDAVQEKVESEGEEANPIQPTQNDEIYDGEVAEETPTTQKNFSDITIDQFANSDGFIKPEGFEGGFSEQGNKSPATKNHTTEEVVAEAIKHINDTDKIIYDKTNVTVSRNANGTTTYTAYFYTADKRITVELDSDLKLIEVKEKDNSGNGTTQIAPAYNPNKE